MGKTAAMLQEEPLGQLEVERGATALVQGDVAYISTGGDADFSAFPYKLLASGRITKVDLKNKRVLMQRVLPTNSYGAATRLGGDGALYVSLYEDLSTFTNRIIKLRADDLTPVTNSTTTWLSLTGADGKATTCASGVADALAARARKPRQRIATRPTRASEERRLAAKRVTAARKRERTRRSDREE